MTNNYIFCAHRGFNTVAPENTLPAFATAIALGVQEIELDLWPSKDGVLYVNHDPSVDRTTDGKGNIVDLTSTQLSQLNVNPGGFIHYRGLKLVTFNQILELFGNQVILNIHIKSIGKMNYPEAIKPLLKRAAVNYQEHRYDNLYGEETDAPADDVLSQVDDYYDLHIMEKIIETIYRYNCQDTVYIAGDKDVLAAAKKLDSKIDRCSLAGKFNGLMVDYALKYDCKRVQFTKGFFDYQLIDKAHQHNIICNLFWSDNQEEARAFFDRGIDVVLTNDYLNVSKIENDI